jgi:hypothetical protein
MKLISFKIYSIYMNNSHFYLFYFIFVFISLIPLIIAFLLVFLILSLLLFIYDLLPIFTFLPQFLSLFLQTFLYLIIYQQFHFHILVVSVHSSALLSSSMLSSHLSLLYSFSLYHSFFSNQLSLIPFLLAYLQSNLFHSLHFPYFSISFLSLSILNITILLLINDLKILIKLQFMLILVQHHNN